MQPCMFPCFDTHNSNGSLTDLSWLWWRLIHLNQVCWSKKTSKTCRAAALKDWNWGNTPLDYCSLLCRHWFTAGDPILVTCKFLLPATCIFCCSGDEHKSRAVASRDRDVTGLCCGCMMGLYGVSDWHAHEVIKEEPACVALNKAPLSLAGHYMRKALASQAQLPHV